MNISEFDYNLPKELIAQFPPKMRGTTRLLVLDRKRKLIEHKKYADITGYIKKGDVIVLNKTKVENVRIFPLVERTGKQIQVLFLETIQYMSEEFESKMSMHFEYWYALIGRAKNVRLGDRLVLDKDLSLYVVDRREGEQGFIVGVGIGRSSDIFSRFGHVPLPPYMKRDDNADDKARYNTVFAEILGSVAAPTASLNLTDEYINQIEANGGQIVYVNLKIGWGTFAPINTDQIEDFKIHHEYYELSDDAAIIINKAISEGRDIWVFGTTAARLVETCATMEKDGKYSVRSGSGMTNIYIYPGYKWKIVNHLITNFHVPKSSLMCLVSSLGGIDLIRKAYAEAVEKKYFFLSYGDSMLIL